MENHMNISWLQGIQATSQELGSQLLAHLAYEIINKSAVDVFLEELSMPINNTEALGVWGHEGVKVQVMRCESVSVWHLFDGGLCVVMGRWLQSKAIQTVGKEIRKEL